MSKTDSIKTIEQSLLDRILYIGDKIPKTVADDIRAKFVVLGMPQDVIDETNLNRDKDTRAVFNLLWDMFNTASDADSPGQVIGRYAGMIDDRIENSGNSRSVDSLKLYSAEQLQDELDSRESTTNQTKEG